MSGISIKQRIALELQRQLIKDQTEKHPLRQLFWESTLRCNMKCRHCEITALLPWKWNNVKQAVAPMEVRPSA